LKVTSLVLLMIHLMSGYARDESDGGEREEGGRGAHCWRLGGGALLIEMSDASERERGEGAVEV
jgi:hypothetical protein